MTAALAREPIPSSSARQNLAIIDIGSNSIRLVVYDGLVRTPQVLFNEKAVCGLAHGLERSGLLNPEGVPSAMASIGRFIRLTRAMRIGTLDILATAAVREATDGRAFVAEIERRWKVKVTVLAGEEEARLAASGVLCSSPDADGLVADLGGGSLELVALDRGKIGNSAATLPLGVLRLSEASGDDNERAEELIDQHFDRVDWLGKRNGRPLYAVGGAWRAVARLGVEQVGHPLHVLDNFTLSRSNATSLLGLIARQSKKSLEKIPGLSRKRLPYLPLAALLLKKVIEHSRASELVFSAYGMREGQFFRRLPQAVREQDPLLAACEHLARSQGRFPAHGDELVTWMAPLFRGEAEAQRRIRHAACLLGDLFWNEHPDYRAEQAFLRVIRLPVMGLDHRDRVALALAVHSRYESDRAPPDADALALLDEDEQRRATLIGYLLRLGHTISGGVPGILSATRFNRQGDSLVLTLPASDPVFAPDLADRRYDRMARLAGAEKFEMKRK
ncbi:MAG TPA: Ppx/GppA family phosphatase [Magnetospirillaceae bacterium]|jgi:exopolyphosphatase/guanosine-5'-triphosphate,3'-diphosphate pyrophosphatase